MEYVRHLGIDNASFFAFAKQKMHINSQMQSSIAIDSSQHRVYDVLAKNIKIL